MILKCVCASFPGAKYLTRWVLDVRKEKARSHRVDPTLCLLLSLKQLCVCLSEQTSNCERGPRRNQAKIKRSHEHAVCLFVWQPSSLPPRCVFLLSLWLSVVLLSLYFVSVYLPVLLLRNCRRSTLLAAVAACGSHVTKVSRCESPDSCHVYTHVLFVHKRQIC